MTRCPNHCHNENVKEEGFRTPTYHHQQQKITKQHQQIYSPQNTTKFTVPKT